MLTLSNCSAGYDGRPALVSTSLAVEAGKIGCVIGPSGCGKTTLLMVAAGLKQRNEGEVTLEGREVRAGDPRVGIILQDYGLFPWFTALENAAIGHRVRGQPARASRAAAAATLARFGLKEKADSYPSALSGGERQRVAIARALTLSPSVLLMDEPFSALDALTRESLQDLLLGTVAREGLCVLLVTHSIEEAACLGSTVWLMGDAPGRIVARFDSAEGQGGPEYRSAPAFFHTCTAIRAAMQRMRNAARP
jgi:ABC-type nitrate/sulfonate/bicarbonate transport system ATPase subunit